MSRTDLMEATFAFAATMKAQLPQLPSQDRHEVLATLAEQLRGLDHFTGGIKAQSGLSLLADDLGEAVDAR